MDLSHANLVHYLATGKLTIEASDYLASMRGRSQASIETIAQTTKNILLSGSKSAVKNAKAIQEIVLSNPGRSLNMNEILIQIVRFLGSVACSIYDIDYENV